MDKLSFGGHCTGCNHRPCVCFSEHSSPKQTQTWNDTTPAYVDQKSFTELKKRMEDTERRLDKLERPLETAITNPGFSPQKVFIDQSLLSETSQTLQTMPKVDPVDWTDVDPNQWDELIDEQFQEHGYPYEEMKMSEEDQKDKQIQELRYEMEVMEGIVKSVRNMRANLSSSPGVRSIPSRSDVMDILIALDALDKFRIGGE